MLKLNFGLFAFQDLVRLRFCTFCWFHNIHLMTDAIFFHKFFSLSQTTVLNAFRSCCFLKSGRRIYNPLNKATASAILYFAQGFLLQQERTCANFGQKRAKMKCGPKGVVEPAIPNSLHLGWVKVWDKDFPKYCRRTTFTESKCDWKIRVFIVFAKPSCT